MDNVKLEIVVLMFIIILVSYSCETSYNSRTYEYIPRTEEELFGYYNSRVLSIKNDSTLSLFIRYGGLGNSQSVKYLTKDNKLIIDSLNINKYFSEVFGTTFVYYNDSIVSEKTNDLYYSRKYTEKINKRLKRDFENSTYLILNNRKYKANPNAFRRVYKQIEPSKYDFIELDKTEAKRLYGINEKYKTYEFLKKKE